MAVEPQAGTVSTAQAMALLLIEHPDNNNAVAHLWFFLLR
jgi:hypothetical protein